MRSRLRPLRYGVPAAALLLVLAGCGDDQPTPESASTTPSTTPSRSATESPSESPSDAPTSHAPSSAPALPPGGTADDPTAVDARTDPLDWKPVDGPVRDTVTRGGGWSLRVPGSGTSYSLEGAGNATGGSQPGFRVSDTLMDADWAVVVLQDKTEQQPSVAEVTDLGSGKTFRVDGHSDVPTTNGGTWALGDGHLLHATVARGSYCIASVDLASRRSTLGWCAPKRHGFSDAHVTPAGDSLLGFDDSRPSCRTVLALDGRRTTPFEGVPDCTGWDGLRTPKGAVWSITPNQHRIEAAHFFAREGDGYYDLGPGVAGSLVWCGGSAYFSRDPQRDGDPATVVRWAPGSGLTVVYQSPGGQAFVSEPRCGGDALTVTAMAEKGDEQVTAAVPTGPSA